MILLIQQLAIGSLKVGRLYPVARHDAWQGDTDTRRSVEPAGARAACQLLTQIRCKMIAVLSQEVVGRSKKLFGGLADDGVDLDLGREGEALKDLGFECAARRFHFRFCPVHARYASSIVAPVCILLAINDDPRVEERRAEKPQGGGYSTGLGGEIAG